MIEIHQTYRPLIIAARCMAAPIAALSYICIPAFLGIRGWEHWSLWEIGVIASPLGYAVFVLLPIQRLRTSAFWPLVAFGTILAVGSFYDFAFGMVGMPGMDGRLLQKRPMFRIVACLLLLPFYAYIPIMILNRKHEPPANN